MCADGWRRWPPSGRRRRSGRCSTTRGCGGSSTTAARTARSCRRARSTTRGTRPPPCRPPCTARRAVRSGRGWTCASPPSARPSTAPRSTRRARRATRPRTSATRRAWSSATSRWTARTSRSSPASCTTGTPCRRPTASFSTTATTGPSPSARRSVSSRLPARADRLRSSTRTRFWPGPIPAAATGDWRCPWGSGMTWPTVCGWGRTGRTT